jgi:hypothetical protein
MTETSMMSRVICPCSAKPSLLLHIRTSTSTNIERRTFIVLIESRDIRILLTSSIEVVLRTVEFIKFLANSRLDQDSFLQTMANISSSILTSIFAQWHWIAGMVWSFLSERFISGNVTEGQPEATQLKARRHIDVGWSENPPPVEHRNGQADMSPESPGLEILKNLLVSILSFSPRRH